MLFLHDASQPSHRSQMLIRCLYTSEACNTTRSLTPSVKVMYAETLGLQRACAWGRSDWGGLKAILLEDYMCLRTDVLYRLFPLNLRTKFMVLWKAQAGYVFMRIILKKSCLNKATN